MKNTGRQSYLHAKSDQPASLKKSIVYSQIFRVRTICSTNSEFECNFEVLQEQFTKWDYDSSSIETEIKKIKLLDSKGLPTLEITQKVNIKQTIWNHRSILKTSKAFSVEPVIAFRKKKKKKTWNNLLEGKPSKTNINKYKGKCTSCKSGIRSLHCLQVQNTHSFRSK